MLRVLALGTTFLAHSSGFTQSKMATFATCQGLQELDVLKAVELKPVAGGKLLTHPPVTAESLWTERPALIYVVRRPG